MAQTTKKKPYRRGSSFHRWLMLQIKRDDPIGDLARDVKIDHERRGKWPYAAVDREEYVQYLAYTGACIGACDALVEAWEEWTHSVL